MTLMPGFTTLAASLVGLQVELERDMKHSSCHALNKHRHNIQMRQMQKKSVRYTKLSVFEQEEPPSTPA